MKINYASSYYCEIMKLLIEIMKLLLLFIEIIIIYASSYEISVHSEVQSWLI